MMTKMRVDFKNQKQFTENAAHEMQTPLAVIKAKIDLLIQSEKLGNSETELIFSIDNAASQLSRLYKALLLLAKIENRQFVVQQKIGLSKIVDDSLFFFADHILAKQINIKKSYLSGVEININPDLCSILVNNLIQNAIRHNIDHGNINIYLKENELMIVNTGNPEPLANDLIFNRFQKKSHSNESVGLGLAIAREIANTNGLDLNYVYKDNLHFFTIIF